MAEEQPREPWSVPDEMAATEEIPASRTSAVELEAPAETVPASASRDAIYSRESEPHPDEMETGPATPMFQLPVEPPRPPERIPNFGHLLILAALILFGVLFSGLITQFALNKHMFGVSTLQRAVTDIHYTLGSEALLYLFMLAAALFLFPMIWHKSLFAGVQWNFATAFRLRWRLISAAMACLLLAAASSMIAPGPTNAPIDKIFRAPGAPWLLFAFGVTFAPFFEELMFRGFLLPAFCTAVDWFGETIAHQPRRPLGPNGHPTWSITAMAIGAVATSIPFAALHAEQTGYSIGPFMLLCGVSLVLCAVRISTRSLAASTLVHACYNFTLFTIMIVGTGGFKHLSNT